MYLQWSWAKENWKKNCLCAPENIFLESKTKLNEIVSFPKLIACWSGVTLGSLNLLCPKIWSSYNIKINSNSRMFYTLKDLLSTLDISSNSLSPKVPILRNSIPLTMWYFLLHRKFSAIVFLIAFWTLEKKMFRPKGGEEREEKRDRDRDSDMYREKQRQREKVNV